MHYMINNNNWYNNRVVVVYEERSNLDRINLFFRGSLYILYIIQLLPFMLCSHVMLLKCFIFFILIILLIINNIIPIIIRIIIIKKYGRIYVTLVHYNTIIAFCSGWYINCISHISAFKPIKIQI